MKNKSYLIGILILGITSTLGRPIFGQEILVSGVGTQAQGAGLMIGNLDANPSPELILMAYDNPSGANNFRYKIGWNLDASAKTNQWSSVKEVPGLGWEADGAASALVNLDNGLQPEMILMAYDDPDELPNSFRYRVGRNVDQSGEASNWEEPFVVMGFDLEAAGAGMSIANIDLNPRPDMVLMAYSELDGPNQFMYRIGWNLDEAGQPESWSRNFVVFGLGNEGQGAGVTITNLDDNLRPEMILMTNDNPAGNNNFRYKIGWNLGTDGYTSSWDDPVVIPGLGSEGQGADIVAFDFGEDSYPDFLMMSYESLRGNNTFLYRTKFRYPSETPEHYALSSNTCRECSSAEIQAWEEVVAHSMGIKVKDPYHHTIGGYPADFGDNLGELFLGSNWYPYNPNKQMACGELIRYGVTKGGAHDEDEHDWNLNILPSDHFSFITNNPASLYSDRGEWKMHDGRYIFEAELTPDEDFFGNKYLKIDESTIFPQDQNFELCVYGPWVSDEWHDDRPEIHPSEMLWWKDSPQGPWHMILAQDDSERFSGLSDFGFDPNNGNPPPTWWKPWAKPPVAGTFNFAVRLNPQETPTLLKITQEYNQHVVTNRDVSARKDADDGVFHSLQYNGTHLMSVQEKQLYDDDLGVRFVDFCRYRDANGQEQLQGYVALTTKVGIDDDGREGFHVLQIDQSKEEITEKEVIVTIDRIKIIDQGRDGDNVYFQFGIDSQNSADRFPSSGTINFPNDFSIPVNHVMKTSFLSTDPTNLVIDFIGGYSTTDHTNGKFASFSQSSNYGSGNHLFNLSIWGQGHPKPKPGKPELLPFYGTYEIAYHIDVNTLSRIDPTQVPPIFGDIESPFFKGRIATVLTGSLERHNDGKQSQLTGNLQVDIQSISDTITDSSALSGVQLISFDKDGNPFRQPLQYERSPNSSLVLIKDVPLITSDRTEIEFVKKGEEPIRFNIPEIGMNAQILNSNPIYEEYDPKAWKSILSAFHLNPNSELLDFELQKLDRLELDVMPSYGTRAEEHFTSDDGLSISSKLNEILSGYTPHPYFKNAFGSEDAFWVDWSIERRELLSEKSISIPLEKNTKKVNIVNQIENGFIPKGSLSIGLENVEESTVHEFVIEAIVKDPFGNQKKILYKFWSHTLFFNQEDIAHRKESLFVLLQTITRDNTAKSTAVDKNQVTHFSTLPERQRDFLSLAVERAVEDKEVSIYELKSLVEYLKTNYNK